MRRHIVSTMTIDSEGMTDFCTTKRRPKVLIVDDKPENLVAMRDVLAEVDADLISAHSGEEALRISLHSEFALAVLDVQMPGMDGFELAEILHGDPRTRQLPIIFVTAAYEDEQQIYKGYRTGAVDYLVKPYPPWLLASKVRVFLDLFRAREALVDNNVLLQASEERYRTLVMTIPDIVYRIDENGRFTFLNGAIKALGYTPSELIGRHFSQIIHPADLDKVSRRAVVSRLTGLTCQPAPGLFDERRTGNRQTVGLEVRLIPYGRDGRNPDEPQFVGENVIIAEVNCAGLYSVPDEYGNAILLGTVGVVRNISDRKRLDQELTSHREHLQELVDKQTAEIERQKYFLRAITDALPGMVSYWDADQRNHFANAAHLKWWGKAPEQIVGLHLRELIGEKLFTKTEPYIRAVLRGEPQHFQSTLMTVAGDTTETWIQFIPNGVADQVRGFYVLATDITEIKRVEFALQESEANFRLLFDSAPDAYLVVDQENALVLCCNQALANMLGGEADQIVGLCPGNFSPPTQPDGTDSRIGAAAILNQVRESGHHRFEWLHRRFDGSDFWTEVVLTNGTYQGRPAIFSNIREIGAIIAAKQAADAANLAKSRFLAMMSHEIRTPLNSIIGMTYSLGRSSLSADQRAQINALDKASHLLLAQVNDILDLAKIEAGEFSTETIDFTPQQILLDIAKLFTSQATSKGLDLRIKNTCVPCQPKYQNGRLVDDCAPCLTGVRGDCHKIEGMLANLVSNAFKFTPAGGQIEIQLDLIESDDRAILLRFSVSDTGIGIAPEAMDRLFQPFTQADSSTTRRFGGTGLGLVLVKETAERLGGRVGANSTLGQGSTFWFELPLERTPALMISTEYLVSTKRLTESTGPALDPDQHGLPGVRVLAVDDNEMNLQVLRRFLEHEGAQATLCESGAAALAQLAARPEAFDIVLMDVQMPDLDGYETTRRIRQQWSDDLPIVALTAGVLASEREAALASGMNDFLTKPVDPVRLVHSVRQQVERFQKRTLPIRPRQEGGFSEDNGWPVIDGLDTDGVRCRLAGDKTLFLRLLDNFLERGTELLAQVGQAVTVGQSKAAIALLHNLRGQAGNLGAMTLAAEAGRLEQAAQAGQLTAEQLTLCLAQLNDFTQAMSQWRQTQVTLVTEEQHDAPLLDAEALADFKKNLARQNVAALYTFEVCSSSLRALLGTVIYQEFNVAMNGLDFAEALRLLNQAAP